ncbi:MAG: hypothetical protein DRN71_02260 [Candidatus Nanohalarchaeota archaeon]|nr:MAG: hypothetical protein DRN71_02260 [Candidatus Nanohaloarchaeota archaeon]
MLVVFCDAIIDAAGLFDQRLLTHHYIKTKQTHIKLKIAYHLLLTSSKEKKGSRYKMLVDIVLGSKSAFRILSVLTKDPEYGYTKEEIKKATKLGGNSIFRTMNILEKNNIITGQKSGRKTQYKINLCNEYSHFITGICQKERDDLNNIDHQTATILREYIRQLSDAVDIDSIYVFGSTVKHNDSKNSDLDIALIFISEPDNDSMMRIKDVTTKIEKRFKKDIDEHIFKKDDFAKMNIPYAEAVHRDGIRLI